MAKADGMLAIVWLLKSRGRMTAKELAGVLEISVRSVYRYVDSLCMSGVPIEAEAGHDGGYRLPESYRNLPLFFSSEERTALAHSALFAQKAGYPFTSSLRGALQKIDYHSSPEQAAEVLRHTTGFDVLQSEDHSAYTETLADFERAIANRETVRMVYRKAKGEADEERDIHPYGLVHWRDRWYVIGWCLLRGDLRTFRADRIVSSQVTGGTFDRPADFSAGDFFATNVASSMGTGDRLSRLRIRGELDSIDDLSLHWYMGPRTLQRWKDEVLFLVEDERLADYVPHLLLSYGQSISIAEPDSVRECTARLGLQLAEHHGWKGLLGRAIP